MNTFSYQYPVNGSQTLPISTAWRKLQGFFRWLMGFFALTDEERAQAGICIGRKECNG